MSERLLIVTADPGYVDTVTAMAQQAQLLDCHVYPLSDETPHQAIHLIVSGEHLQAILDRLQSILGGATDWRISILPVEATVPRRRQTAEEAEAEKKGSARQSREALYDGVANSARLDWSFLVFVALSTVVAAIGLIKDNVAVVIGAMVIAPLLGPNLAFALGVALGDRSLMAKAMGTNAVGVIVSVMISVVIGLVWPLDLHSHELMARTDVGFDGVALALASGAAAALSLTTGLSSALVGVMVAVALLPPAATIGLMVGAGRGELALGAALLLAVNIVCVNISAQIAFVMRRITPRTWYERQTARRAVLINAVLWLLLLAALAALLAVRTPTL